MSSTTSGTTSASTSRRSDRSCSGTRPASTEPSKPRPGLAETEIEERFARSGGKGGQNVNKVSTAVILVHTPTGITVRCEESRSQAANRALARRLLAAKVAAWRERERQRVRQALERKRRSERRPSRAAQRRRLEAKARRSDIKETRSRPGWDE